MVGRLSKIVMCLALALFAALVTFDNIVDYGSNYAFVQHVLSMDTTLPGTHLKDRALTGSAVWTAAYDLIILGESLTALLYLVSAGALWSTRNAPAEQFQYAKRWVHAAAATGFVVWFFGFMVIGGEWFAMWQSTKWNGQEPAFRFTMILLAVLVFVNQRDESPGRD